MMTVRGLLSDTNSPTAHILCHRGPWIGLQNIGRGTMGARGTIDELSMTAESTHAKR